MTAPSSTHSTDKPQKALVVIGTRPEAIKLAPVVKALKSRAGMDVRVCATGQHTDMLFPLLDWFGVKRDYTLDVMEHGQPLSHLAGKLMAGLHDVMAEFNPDIVVVQGDTTSAFVGAMAAYYSYDYFWKSGLRTAPAKTAHVEAGLRTGNNYSPYPEEVNRRLIGHMCHWSFAPTQESADALAREGIHEGVYVTGNTVIDALFETGQIVRESGRNPLPQIGADKKIVLVTSHRRENYGTGLQEICEAVKTLAARYADAGIEFVYPVHLNRNVQGPVHNMLGDLENVHLMEPQDYPDFVAMMNRSHLILTDSGGVQEEAPSLGKPVLVMRENTERPEAVSAGTAKLIGAKAGRIIAETTALLDSELLYRQMAQAKNPYGDGKAAQRIANLLCGECAEKNFFGREAA
jgi:UDP-N-acetylglucosamine 2-epimerase (non-hydrolysing)